MDNPTLYIFGDDGSYPAGSFSNLEWGKGEAKIRAEAREKTQVVYKLVPVFRVDVKITKELQVSEPGDGQR